MLPPALPMHHSQVPHHCHSSHHCLGLAPHHVCLQHQQLPFCHAYVLAAAPATRSCCVTCCTVSGSWLGFLGFGRYRCLGKLQSTQQRHPGALFVALQPYINRYWCMPAACNSYTTASTGTHIWFEFDFMVSAFVADTHAVGCSVRMLYSV